jgi:hypothetical protein
MSFVLELQMQNQLSKLFGSKCSVSHYTCNATSSAKWTEENLSKEPQLYPHTSIPTPPSPPPHPQTVLEKEETTTRPSPTRKNASSLDRHPPSLSTLKNLIGKKSTKKETITTTVSPSNKCRWRRAVKTVEGQCKRSRPDDLTTRSSKKTRDISLSIIDRRMDNLFDSTLMKDAFKKLKIKMENDYKVKKSFY